MEFKNFISQKNYILGVSFKLMLLLDKIIARLAN